MRRIQRKLKREKKKISHNPYAQIDWDKAAALFQKPLNSSANKSKSFISIKQLLQVLAAAGTIGLLFAFPGAAAGISALVLGRKSYPRWQTKQIIGQLSRQKFVEIKYNNDDTVTVKITHKGMLRALTYRLDAMELKKPKAWDRKWRVVIFDIPEKYKRVREIFRMRLRQLGLYQLQESVYISPYRCFDEIEFLRELYGVAFTVKYLLVDKVEDDEFLKDRFDLS